MPPNDRLRTSDTLNSGQRVPAMRLVKDNPKSAALVSKLVVDHRAPTQQKVLEPTGAGINASGLRAIANEGMQSVNDSETVRQLLSDTDLAAQILVSVILSPQDMMGVEVGYQSNLTHWNVPHEVNTTMTNSVRDYLEEVYKIKPRLPTIVEDILFRRGSYPVAVLPENAIDDMIHNNGSELSNESLNEFRKNLDNSGNIKSLSILGPLDAQMPQRSPAAPGGYKAGLGLALEHLITAREDATWNTNISVEWFKDDEHEANRKDPQMFDTHISVTDNINLLKFPQFSTKLREVKMKKTLGKSTALSTESMIRRIDATANSPIGSSGNITGTHFHRQNQSQTIVKEIKGQDKLKRRSIGPPLEIHFPSESVIPVHVPNQPSKQIGFFVLLDAEGNPINRGQGVNHFRELGQSLTNSSFASSMIQRAGSAMNDNSSVLSRSSGGATMGRMYGQMLERDLYQRLKNGSVGGNVSLAGSEEVYFLMLTRSLANQQTQVLYIPAEYMTYIALEYNTSGTGKSLLDNTKIIDSMQANLLVGTVMGALRNSVGRTHVDLKLDPDMPDPWKSIEVAMGEIIRVNGDGFPLGTINPLDIKDGLIRSQFEFGFSGHPKLPDMSVEFTEKNTNYNPPDQKLIDDLRKRRLMAFYLTPEMVDAASGADFATSVANNSTLLSKRAMGIQQELTPQLSAHVRKHISNCGDLIDELIEVIAGNYDDIIAEFDDKDAIEMFDGTKVTKDELKTDRVVKAQFIKELVEDFIGGFELTLPEPTTTKMENLTDLYSKQSSFIEEGIKAWISPDMLDASMVGEELANHNQVIAAQLKAMFLRDWQVKNGMLPELTQFTSRDEHGELEFDLAGITSQHTATMMDVMLEMLTSNKAAKEKAKKALEDAGVEESDSASSSASFGDSADNNGGDGGFGGDDFSFDMSGTDEATQIDGETPVDGETPTTDEETPADADATTDTTDAPEAETPAPAAEESEPEAEPEPEEEKKDDDKDEKKSLT